MNSTEIQGNNSLFSCRICNNSTGNSFFNVREMMFGSGDVFQYILCGDCGCLQIKDFPSNIGDYYPKNYYSFQVQQRGIAASIKKWIRSRRDASVLFHRGMIGSMMSRQFHDLAINALEPLQLNPKSRILDVGSGIGLFVNQLKDAGCKEVLGIDPFIEKDFMHKNGSRVEKKSIFEVSGTWDVIMFHHSFEHLPQQQDILVRVRELLSPEGVCVIRIPTVSSDVWETYRSNWVQLDAPRHYFLHSRESIRRLSHAAGFAVTSIVDDSTEFQFWGSEQYKKGIFLESPQSYKFGLAGSMFSADDIRIFQQKARELNKIGRGDSIVCYLKKA